MSDRTAAVAALSPGVAVAVGVALAVAVAVSPVFVVGVALIAAVWRMALLDRSGIERRALSVVLGVAIAARLALVLFLFLRTTPGAHEITSFAFDGDGAFMKLRALWERNLWLGVPVEKHHFDTVYGRYGRTAYIEAIALLQYWLGPAPYALHLVNIAAYTGASVLFHRILRPSFGALSALLAFVALLFLPTLLMWSSSALKESYYLLLLVAAALGMLAVGRGSWRRRVIGVLVLGAAIYLIAPVRAGGQVIVWGSMGLALAGTWFTRRRRLALALAILVSVAWLAGGAEHVKWRLLPRLVDAANIHIGNVHTEGHSYKVLDQRFYSGDPLDTMTWPESGRFVIRALVAFVVVPLPQQAQSASELVLLPQQMLWYLALLLLVPGIREGLRRDAFLTWLWLGFAIAGGGVIALNSGNVGTVVRIRDSIVPFVVSLSALGAVSVFRALAARDVARHAPVSAPVAQEGM